MAKKKNAFYAQSGGVTAVINASAAGVIEAARKHADVIGKVYAGRDGIIGALTENLIDTSRESDGAIAAQADRGFEALRSEQFLQTQANAGIVFDDENARFHGEFWAKPGESGRVKRNTLPPPSRGLKVTLPP